MDNGKRICKTLKELRKRIADAYDISYEIKECPYNGPCSGTCQECKNDLDELFDQLNWLEMEGRKLNLRNLMTKEEFSLFCADGPSEVRDIEELHHPKTGFKFSVESAAFASDSHLSQNPFKV